MREERVRREWLDDNTVDAGRNFLWWWWLLTTWLQPLCWFATWNKVQTCACIHTCVSEISTAFLDINNDNNMKAYIPIMQVLLASSSGLGYLLCLPEKSKLPVRPYQEKNFFLKRKKKDAYVARLTQKENEWWMFVNRLSLVLICKPLND